MSNERPTWVVYVENFNYKCIEEYNIFDYVLFWDDCQIAWITPISRDDFKNNKIDVSDQIKLNEKQFLTYLWNWFTERKLENNG